MIKMIPAACSAALILTSLVAPSFGQDCRIPLGAKIYVAPMPEGLHDFIAAEVMKRKARVELVQTDETAEYILAGSSRQTGDAKWFDVVFGTPKDKNEASVRLIKVADKSMVWAAEAGDRSLLFSALRRGGQRKVAARLVEQMKDDLCKK